MRSAARPWVLIAIGLIALGLPQPLFLLVLWKLHINPGLAMTATDLGAIMGAIFTAGRLGRRYRLYLHNGERRQGYSPDGRTIADGHFLIKSTRVSVVSLKHTVFTLVRRRRERAAVAFRLRRFKPWTISSARRSLLNRRLRESAHFGQGLLHGRRDDVLERSRSGAI